MLHRRSKHILCVDDHADTRELYKHVLSPHKVATAATVLEARAVCIESVFDLLVLDDILPDGTGMDICRAVRKIDSNTPIVVVSADARESRRNSAMAAGANAFVPKPVEIESFRGQVGTLLEESDLQSCRAALLESAAVMDQVIHSIEKRKGHLARASAHLARADAALRRARESALKALGREVFIKAGGTPANFENLWLDVLDQARTD
jgi:DNA-binding response OmpR family regulator